MAKTSSFGVQFKQGSNVIANLISLGEFALGTKEFIDCTTHDSADRFREYLVGAQHVLFPGAPLHGILHALDERGIIRRPENAVDAWLDLRARAIREGEGAIEINLSSGRWLRVTDRPTEDGGIVSIVSDITEAKDREETLRTAKDLAEQGSRSSQAASEAAVRRPIPAVQPPRQERQEHP